MPPYRALLGMERVGKTRGLLFAIIVAIGLFVVIIRAAWLCDDAFITLRSVDNWVSGHGLRWNPSERVQSFTHPLWMFVVALPYAVTRNPSFALLVPAVLATTVFLWGFVRSAEDKWLATGLLLALMSSKAFVEFSTSGLENPLLHLLMLAFALTYFQVMKHERPLWMLLLVLALLLTTRMDTFVLLAPASLAAAVRARAELRHVRTWLALAPILAWEGFSLLYYGFPFPNTAYAKLETGVPRDEALAQGLRFMRACFTHDPTTSVLLAASVLAGLTFFRKPSVWLSLGVVSWLSYLLTIGGDFMIGRLLTPALVLSMLVLLQATPPKLVRWVPACAGALLLVAFNMPRTALRGAPAEVLLRWLPDQVTDERAIFHTWTGLFRDEHTEGPKGHPWVTEALAHVARGERVFPARSVGFVGYFCGPGVHIVDEFALSDPLLARLPAHPGWSPGHFERKVPAGYLETLVSGRNQLTIPIMAKRYDELWSILRAPLFDSARLRTILRWNLTRPRMYPADYEVRRADLDMLGRAQGGERVTAKGVLQTGEQGLDLRLSRPVEVQGFTIAVGADDRYQILLRRGKKTLWQGWVEPTQRKRKYLASHTVHLVGGVLVDSVRIKGRRGDGRYHVGSLRLETQTPEGGR